MARQGRTRIRLVALGLVSVLALVGAACSADGGGATTDDPVDPGAVATGPGSSGTTSGRAPGAEPRSLAAGDDLYAAAAAVTPDELARPHGTLLASQPVEPAPVAGARVARILYVSAAANGDPVPVTGMVAIPDAPAPEGGRVVLTIAHGTSGSADRCAPSRSSRLADTELPLGVARGWIVAVSDYQGLGGPGPHPYLVGPSEGRNVIDAALAAGQLPDAHAGPRLAIAGYSQGGHGALWAAQVAPEWAPDLDVVGTFAGAPATELDVILAALPVVSVSGGFGLLMANGFQVAYGVDPADILTPAGLDQLREVDGDICIGAIATRAATSSGLFRSDVPRTSDWFRLAAENNPGQVRLADPVLIIHSDEDRTVPVALSKVLDERMCRVGTVVERRVLVGGGDHGQAAPTAYLAAVAWFQGLLDGTAPVDGCAAREATAPTTAAP